MKVVENSPQNPRNCTILKKFLGGTCPQTPLAKARSFAACISKFPEILKLGPPPLRNPAYAPGRVNSVLYDFKDIPCDVKAKLLDSYCLDVYGSQLWNYSKHDVDMYFTAWRKSIRRLWNIPNTTHCNLLSSINSSVPIVINLERRCAKFIWFC